MSRKVFEGIQEHGADKIRAVFTERYTRLCYLDILSRMRNRLCPDREVHSIFGKSLMVIKVPGPYEAFNSISESQVFTGLALAKSKVGVLVFVSKPIYSGRSAAMVFAETGVSPKFWHFKFMPPQPGRCPPWFVCRALG